MYRQRRRNHLEWLDKLSIRELAEEYSVQLYDDATGRCTNWLCDKEGGWDKGWNKIRRLTPEKANAILMEQWIYHDLEDMEW